MRRRKPEQVVPLLLARLNEVKKWSLEKSDNDISLASIFKEIEDKLESLTDLYPSIKLLEEKTRDQLYTVEQQLYQYDRTFKEQESAEFVREKLALLETDLRKLKETIDEVAEIGTTNLGKKLNKPEQSAPTRTEDKEDDQAMSKEWENLKIEEKISESKAMSRLLASFRSLESFQVKMCLMFLSVFPEKSVIKKKPVIYWWIGEGVVTKKVAETAEEVGQKVFQQLLNRGFIKRSNEDNNSITVKSFIVHPWIRRMLILAAKENNFLKFSSNGTPLNGLQRAFSCEEDQNVDKDLLAFFNVKDQYLRIKSSLLSKSKKMEVLQLGRWINNPKYHIEVENQEELLNGLGPQKLLKYLSLHGISGIETLPDSMAKLFSLEILDLSECHHLERLPQAVTTLRNLTHLDVSHCYLLESMPKGLQHLGTLQVLKGFVIGKEWDKSCRISDLSRELKKLRKLSVRISSNDDGAEGQLSQLHHFPALQILTISWGVKSSKKSTATFPTSLRKLDLRLAPEWMLPENLPSLEKLYVTGGYINLRSASVGLKTVKFLRFSHLKSFRIAPHQLLALFPKYLRCEIINCDGQSNIFDNNGC